MERGRIFWSLGTLGVGAMMLGSTPRAWSQTRAAITPPVTMPYGTAAGPIRGAVLTDRMALQIADEFHSALSSPKPDLGRFQAALAQLQGLDFQAEHIQRTMKPVATALAKSAKSALWTIAWAEEEDHAPLNGEVRFNTALKLHILKQPLILQLMRDTELGPKVTEASRDIEQLLSQGERSGLFEHATRIAEALMAMSRRAETGDDGAVDGSAGGSASKKGGLEPYPQPVDKGTLARIKAAILEEPDPSWIPSKTGSHLSSKAGVYFSEAGNGRRRIEWLNVPTPSKLSPDGKLLALRPEGHPLYFVSPDTLEIMSETVVPSPREIQWSPDGRFLLIQSYSDSRIRVVDSIGRRPVRMIDVLEGQTAELRKNKSYFSKGELSWSADGKDLIFQNEHGAVSVIDFATGKTARRIGVMDGAAMAIHSQRHKRTAAEVEAAPSGSGGMAVFYKDGRTSFFKSDDSRLRRTLSNLRAAWTRGEVRRLEPSSPAAGLWTDMPAALVLPSERPESGLRSIANRWWTKFLQVLGWWTRSTEAGDIGRWSPDGRYLPTVRWLDQGRDEEDGAVFRFEIMIYDAKGRRTRKIQAEHFAPRNPAVHHYPSRPARGFDTYWSADGKLGVALRNGSQVVVWDSIADQAYQTQEAVSFDYLVGISDEATVLRVNESDYVQVRLGQRKLRIETSSMLVKRGFRPSVTVDMDDALTYRHGAPARVHMSMLGLTEGGKLLLDFNGALVTVPLK